MGKALGPTQRDPGGTSSPLIPSKVLVDFFGFGRGEGGVRGREEKRKENWGFKWKGRILSWVR